MLSIQHWPEAARTLGRTYGARGAALRVAHEVRRAGGRFRAAAREQLTNSARPAPHPFAVDPGRLAGAVDVASARGRGDYVASGYYEAYRWDWRRLPEDAAAWLRNDAAGFAYSPDAPWWRVPHLRAAAGDIKDVWEPARFGWAYDLVRAALLTDDSRYAAAFRARFAAWRASSPPFRGTHWSCGQETAIRAVALLYAEANLPPTAGLAEVLAASGERIADAFGYAVSQRNNHAISEAAGLVALGVRFRDQHPDARRWLLRGRRWLARLIPEQFAADGWYVQHSFTYLRLALDQCVVAERALRAVGETLPPAAAARLAAAAELLLAVVDPATGDVPNHGANDGAFVHPITSAGYRDFRPVLTAACAMWRVPLPAGVRADGETLAWLGADAPPVGPPLADGVRSGTSGWAAVRAGDTHVFLRAGRYASRPGHLDPLHLEVRVGGAPAVIDAGTFAYNAPPPWRNALVSARVHNGPVLDGREPGVRGPRFLWYLWPAADLVRADWDGREATLVAEDARGVRRTVVASAEGVRVVDEVPPGAAERVVVRWTLHPDARSDVVRVDGPSDLRAAAEGDVLGWYSPAYGARVASRWVEIDRDAAGGAVVVTRIAHGAAAHARYHPVHEAAAATA